MIIGIGIDSVDIRRIEQTIKRFGTRFLNRVFTLEEQARSEKQKNKIASYAKRFAAKEAMVKALGTGIGKGVGWKDVCILNNQYNQPKIELNGKAKTVLDQLCEKKTSKLHISLTDEYPYAQAYIIIEALKN